MRILPSIRPTDNQRRVLARILASATPTVAAEAISGDTNLVAARNMLMKLGAIAYTQQEATLTDRGMQIAVDENIATEDGQLTPAGEQLAFTHPNGQPVNSGPAPTTESFSLLKELLG